MSRSGQPPNRKSFPTSADGRKVDANFSKFRSGGRTKLAVVAMADTSFTLDRDVADGIERPLSLPRQKYQPCTQG